MSAEATALAAGETAEELDARLAEVDDGLRRRLSDVAGEDPRLLAQRIELFYEISGLRQERRENSLLGRLDVLARIQESLDELHRCETPQDLIEAAPRELCRSCGFTRALISRLHGSRWIPEVLETAPTDDGDRETFASYTEATEIPLDHMLPEAELVRRRMPAIVTDPVAHPLSRGNGDTAVGTTAYVAAPIMPTGRVIGFLHADRLGHDEPLTTDDLDNLWTFAEQFGFLYERAVLVERLASQRDHLRRAFAGAEEVVEELCDRGIELARSDRHAPEPSRTAAALFRPPESRLDGLLTRREREVLELMTSGATNTRIAEQLVISEGTVKSHVKHILRKLRAANRAEAVARYLQIMLREQEEARRR